MADVHIDKTKQDIISVKMYKDKKCVFKKVADILDFSFILEKEGSRRMQDCDQVYKVMEVQQNNGNLVIISEYVEGQDLTSLLSTLTEDQLTSVVCQVLMLIYLIHIAGISHNDLHCSNIRIGQTDQTTFQYFCGGRSYSIPTHGIKASLIDFGAAFILDIDRPLHGASMIFMGDSFMRLDVRYDTYRFLKSLVDCMQWKKVNNCTQLISMLEQEMVVPLKLGIYGVPDALVNMAPVMFNRFLSSRLKRHTPMISADIIGLLHMWPEKLPANQSNIATALSVIRGVTLSTAEKWFAFVTQGVESFEANSLVPLVVLWREFLSIFQSSIGERIRHIFDNDTIIQNPLWVVDWIITHSIQTN